MTHSASRRGAAIDAASCGASSYCTERRGAAAGRCTSAVAALARLAGRAGGRLGGRAQGGSTQRTSSLSLEAGWQLRCALRLAPSEDSARGLPSRCCVAIDRPRSGRGDVAEGCALPSRRARPPGLDSTGPPE